MDLIKEEPIGHTSPVYCMAPKQTRGATFEVLNRNPSQFGPAGSSNRKFHSTRSDSQERVQGNRMMMVNREKQPF
jgi:hypothetical protein